MKDNDRHLFRSLIANKDFRDWVYNPTENRNHYWEKWSKANEDKKGLLIEARNAIIKLKFREDKINDDRLEDILVNIISSQGSSIQEQEDNKAGRNIHLGWWLMIASSIIFFITIFLVYLTRQGLPESDSQLLRKIQNPIGQKCKIKLPDGSMVDLNSESTLSFPSEFSDTLRWVELDGEAFFEVRSNDNKPFIVRTDRLEAQVFDATFQINAYENQDETGIALLSGKVIVNAISSQGQPISQELFSGEKLNYNRITSRMKKTAIKPEEQIVLTEDLLVLKKIKSPAFKSSIEDKDEQDISYKQNISWAKGSSCFKGSFLLHSLTSIK